MVTPAERLARMIKAAEVKITHTNSYATFEDGNFQVYLTPVAQRTRAMKAHYRVGYYLLIEGQWKRTNKATFLGTIEHEASA